MGDPRSEPSVEAMRREYEARRDYVYRRLKAISGVEVVEPKGAFYIFPRIGGDDVAASERLLSEVKVVVAPGSSFGTYGKGHLRLCYATSMDNLAKAMDRMETFISQGHQNVGAKMNMA
jgi:aspartate/methionine/tyrosine aminotransferase